jgi:hypothetical protein
VGQGFFYPFRMPFTPRGLFSLSPFTHGDDEAAPVGAGGVRVGKFTHPSAAPGGDLLVAFSPGPANDLNRPTPLPYYDSGIYVVPQGAVLGGPQDLVLVKNDPAYNEAWPRAVVPYAAVHGVPAPVEIPWLPNDGTLHAELPAGTPLGLVGTSSFYKRESFPGYVSPWANSFSGLDAFNTSENGQSPNWVTQGAEAGRYTSPEIWAVRLVALEPNTHRSYGPNEGRQFTNFAGERMRILGEIPLRKFDAQGSPVLDPEGHPDTSFLAKVPADTPFTFQTLDRNGAVLNMAQTWHQVRPGEKRVNCGGCHAHSQPPLAFEATAAARPGYTVHDLSRVTPLLTRNPGGDPGLRFVNAPLENVEFYRDIRPLLQRSCVPCHQGPTPPGNLNLADTSVVGGLPGDYRRLADDQAAQFGHPPVIANRAWRQTNASRYVRMFQSRRSLLVWKILGQRLDGWTNADHPTETVPGNPATLPPGADPSAADLDYTGEVMPPPGSGVPPLSEEEKLRFVRWIDLGCPLDQGPKGWFLDDLKPTVEVSLPRPGYNAGSVGLVRYGLVDSFSGLDMSTLSVTADFPVGGRPAGAELKDLAAPAGDRVFQIVISPPVTNAGRRSVRVSARDVQGNVARVRRTFRTVDDILFADSFQPW